MYLNLRYKQAMYRKYLKLGTLKVQKVVVHNMGIIWFDLAEFRFFEIFH